MQVEQELLKEGLPQEELLKLCDIHSAVLEGHVDLSAAKAVPTGHPMDVLHAGEQGADGGIGQANAQLAALDEVDEADVPAAALRAASALFNQLMDVDKHYLRKEYLLFPYLERGGVTGPPKVMWGKHDEIRDLLKGSLEVLKTPGLTNEELLASSRDRAAAGRQGRRRHDRQGRGDPLPDAHGHPLRRRLVRDPEAVAGVRLLPVRSAGRSGPRRGWRPPAPEAIQQHEGRIQLPTGSFSVQDLLAILNTLPVDITFVGSDDKVKYFSQGRDRIFQRNRAILGRDVRQCHPPASAHIVDKILEDFRSGRQNRAPFWINMGGRLIHIEYFALRRREGRVPGHPRGLSGPDRLPGAGRRAAHPVVRS